MLTAILVVAAAVLVVGFVFRKKLGAWVNHTPAPTSPPVLPSPTPPNTPYPKAQ